MPGAPQGAIVANFLGDTTGLETATRRASANIEQFSKRSKNNFTQLGFAAQDFVSILAGGGANSLPRAIGAISNNLAVLGGLGMFASLAAVAYQAAKAFESAEDPAKALADRIDEIGNAAERMADKAEKSFSFLRSVRKLRTTEAVEDAMEANEGELEALEDRISRKRESRREQIIEMILGGKIKGRGGDVMGNFDAAGNPLPGVLTTADDQVVERMKKLDDEIKDLEDTRDRRQRRRGLLQQQEAIAFQEQTAKQASEVLEKQRQRDEAIEKRRKGIRESAMTPSEKLQSKLAELRDEFNQSILDAETFGMAADQALADFARGVPQGRLSAGPRGLARGSSEAISAIRAAEVDANDPRKEQIRLAKTQVELAQKQVAELEELNRKSDESAIVGLSL